MKNYPEWVINAQNRIKARNKTILLDTPELAKEYGENIGTTVIIPTAPVFRVGDVARQEQLDETMVEIHGLW